MPSATLSSKGQTVIPKVIRDHLGLHPGDRLEFIPQENGDIVIRPVASDVRKLKGMFYRPGRKAVSVTDMNRAIEEEAAKGT